MRFGYIQNFSINIIWLYFVIAGLSFPHQVILAQDPQIKVYFLLMVSLSCSILVILLKEVLPTPPTCRCLNDVILLYDDDMYIKIHILEFVYCFFLTLFQSF